MECLHGRPMDMGLGQGNGDIGGYFDALAEYALTLGAGETGGIDLLCDTVETVGSNLVTDSGFDAVTTGADSFGEDFSTDNTDQKETGWSHDAANSEYDCDGSQTGYTSLAWWSKILTAGECYLYEFEVANYSAGDVRMILGSGAGAGSSALVTANGVYTGYANNSSGSASIIFQANSSFIGSVKNATVKQITFTNWTAGTGWAPEASAGALTGKAAKVAGTASNLLQVGVLSATGTTDRSAITIVRTAGYLSFSLGGTSGTTRNSSGTYLEDIVVGGSDSNCVIYAASTFAGTIDNVTVRQVTNPKQNGITVEIDRVSDQCITSKTVAGTCTVLDATSVDVFGTDLLSGWDLTSGWTATGATTIDDADSFTTVVAANGIYRGVTGFETGKTYQLVIAGTTTAGTLRVTNTSATQIFGTGFGTHEFTVTAAANIYLQLLSSAGTVDITTFTLKEVPAKDLIVLHDSNNELWVWYDGTAIYNGTVSDASIVDNKQHYAVGDGNGTFTAEPLQLGTQALSNAEFTDRTEGSELVTGTDSDMSGANNWINDNLGTFDINTTVAGKMYMLGDGGDDHCHLGSITTAGRYYKVSLKARLNAGASTAIRFGNIGQSAAHYFEFTPTGTEQTFTGYFVAHTVTGVYLGLSSAAGGLSGIAFEIDDVSVKEITLDDWLVATRDATNYLTYDTTNDRVGIYAEDAGQYIGQALLNGQLYKYEVDIETVTSQGLYLLIASTSVGGVWSTSGVKTGYFVSPGTIVYLSRSGFTTDVDVNSFKLWPVNP